MTTWYQTVRLEISKKVLLVYVPQGAAKLQAVKVLSSKSPANLRLEASKKVLLVHVPQGAAKLQAVKLLVFQKNQKCS